MKKSRKKRWRTTQVTVKKHNLWVISCVCVQFMLVIVKCFMFLLFYVCTAQECECVRLSCVCSNMCVCVCACIEWRRNLYVKIDECIMDLHLQFSVKHTKSNNVRTHIELTQTNPSHTLCICVDLNEFLMLILDLILFCP